MVHGARRGLRRWAAMVVLGGFAVACTGTTDWRKPGTTEATARRHIDACREAAAAAARREESRHVLAHGDITMNRGDALGSRRHPDPAPSRLS